MSFAESLEPFRLPERRHPVVLPRRPFLPVALAVSLMAGVGFALYIKQSAFLGLLISAYVFSVILVLRIPFLLLTGHRLDLYLTRRAAIPGGWAFLVSVGLFLGMTLLREGSFSYQFDFSLNQWQAHTTSQSNSNANVTHNGPRTPLVDLPILCELPQAEGRGKHLLEGFDDFFKLPDPPQGSWRVQVRVHLDAHDSAAFLPLYKSATVHFTANVTFTWQSPTTQGNGNLTVNGDVQQTVWGICSCRNFNKSVGQEIAKQVLPRINEFLAKN